MACFFRFVTTRGKKQRNLAASMGGLARRAKSVRHKRWGSPPAAPFLYSVSFLLNGRPLGYCFLFSPFLFYKTVLFYP